MAGKTWHREDYGEEDGERYPWEARLKKKIGVRKAPKKLRSTYAGKQMRNIRGRNRSYQEGNLGGAKWKAWGDGPESASGRT